MRHIFGKMLQIKVLLKNDHLVEENKKTDQGFQFEYFRNGWTETASDWIL